MKDPMFYQKERKQHYITGGVIGFFIGCIVTFVACLLIQTTIYALDDSKEPLDKVYEEEIAQPPITYFDVKHKNKVYRLHTGMPKDSVIQLLGQPESSSMYNYTHLVIERMTFGEYSDCLRLTFENGKLKEYNY